MNRFGMGLVVIPSPRQPLSKLKRQPSLSAFNQSQENGVNIMKITIKTLQQKLFTVDVDPDDTVATIKSKISDEHGHPVTSQKLIYSGTSAIFVSSL